MSIIITREKKMSPNAIPGLGALRKKLGMGPSSNLNELQMKYLSLRSAGHTVLKPDIELLKALRYAPSAAAKDSCW